MFGKSSLSGHHRRMMLEARNPVVRSNAEIYEGEGKESPWKARQGLSSQGKNGEGGFIIVDHFNDAPKRGRR